MYRMVTSYWDMAASFVNRGAIDEAMFMDSAGEIWVVFLQDPTVCRRTPRAVSEPEFVQAYGGSPYAATECT